MMKISDFISGGKVNSLNLKTFIKPFLGILVIFVFLLILIKVGLSKINLQISEYKSAKDVEAMLSSKLSRLSSDNQKSLESANKLVVALPERNSAMAMISQIKKLASEKNLTVGKLEISGSKTEANLNSVQLTAEIRAQDLASMVDYFRTLPELAPLSSIFEVRIIREAENTYGGSVELSVYWSDFPLTIPAVREPVVSLTKSEQSALEIISTLREPEYQVLDPSTPSERTEPFN